MAKQGRQFGKELDIASSDLTATCVIDDAGCETLASLGFTQDRIFPVSDNESGSEIRMVLAGRTDFFIANPVYLPYRLQQLEIDKNSFRKVKSTGGGNGFYLAASKTVKKQFRDKIRSAAKELKLNGVNLTIQKELIRGD